MNTFTVKLNRVLNAPPERVYKAFINSEAMVKWLPPFGFTGKIIHNDTKPGGTYKMSFTNFTTGSSHTFGGKYVELVPNEKIVNTDLFDDPNLPGEMRSTVTLKKSICGYRVNNSTGRHSGSHPRGRMLPGVAAIPDHACTIG